MLENHVKNTKYQVSTKEGYKNFSGINFSGEKEGFYIKLENGYKIRCSTEHLISTVFCKIKAKDLKIGDFVEVDEIEASRVISKRKINKKFKCYDLTDVESNDHTYITNGINVSNCAIISTPMWDEFYTSTYPVITESLSSKIILVSTPKGKNHFYQMFRDAQSGENEFKPIKVSWDMVPGRDEAWKETTIKNFGFGGKYKFLQEYECEFISADNTLISAEILKELDYTRGNSILEIKELSELFEYEKHITIFEKVKKGRCYSIGFDSAKMTKGNANDSICIQVLDVTEFPFEQVMTCSIRSGISYLELTKILAPIIRYYKGTAFIENNGEGQEIANLLYRDYDMVDEIFCEKPGLTGFRTTIKTKRIGLSFLKTLIENNKLILKDKDTIFQLTSFTKHGTSYQAESGFYDDAVMALTACLFFLQCSDERIENIFENIKIPEKANFVAAIINNKGMSNREKEEITDNIPDEDKEEISPGLEAIDVNFNFNESIDDNHIENDFDYSDYEEYQNHLQHTQYTNSQFKNL